MIFALLACFSTSVAPVDNCAGCHLDVVAAPHAAVACVSCHLGDPTTDDKTKAHATIEREPGALDTVDQTCGTCHPSEVTRVRSLPMTTARGLVAVDRMAFGENTDGTQTIADVLATEHPTRAEDHTRKMCAGCHLGTRRDNRDDAVSGGSGCAACHSRAGDTHPIVDARVEDERCFGCHSRSSRIALSYAGLAEREPKPGEAPAQSLADGRALYAEPPDLHAAAGMACVDCHVHTELMGDGTSRERQADQTEVRCESCHEAAGQEGVGRPWSEVGDPVLGLISAARAIPHTGRVAVGERGTPLWNVQDGVLTGKLDGKARTIPVVASDHGGAEHARLACAACHATRAPVCASCHVRHDTSGEQWDFSAGATTAGRWIEEGGHSTIAAPALGVDPNGRVMPAIPGMIATIEGVATPVRWFSLLDPHTTSTVARTCVDCHRSPAALGLGTGELSPETFRFTPARPDPAAPDRAVDGWVALGAGEPGVGTRAGVRSLNAEEQRKILRVGVCLGCHERAVWSDFAAAVAERGRCERGEGWWDLGPAPTSSPASPGRLSPRRFAPSR